MNCNRCGSDDIIRSRRKGIWDRLQSALGRWPYRCEDCSYRFLAPYRYPHQAPPNNFGEKPSYQAPGQDYRAYATSAERQGPDMLFQTHAEKPQAKIVLQADTHEQLNHILIALNRAVNSYQSSSQGAGKNHQYSESKSEPAGARR